MKSRRIFLVLFLAAGLLSGGLFFHRKLFFEAPFSENNPRSDAQVPRQNLAKLIMQESRNSKEELAAGRPSLSLSPVEQKKWESFLEILQSKNDNDPRVDKDLLNLSEPFKQALRDYYQNLPMEKRNERGFIAFLISRQVGSENDVFFLKSILKEKPCLSMADCNTQGFQDPHHASTDNVSLNYPQLVVLYELENKLKTDVNLSLPQRQWMLEILQSGSYFPAGIVSSRAHEALQRF